MTLVDEHRNEQMREDHGAPGMDDLREGETFAPDSLMGRLEAATLTTEQLIALPLPTYLVDGLIPRDGITVVYGQPGTSKSFFALDITGHVATGNWWNGREVAAGPVVYVVAESPAGMGMRADAWNRHHGIYDLGKHHPVYWLTLPPNLSDTVQALALVDYCRRRDPVLVVIDTLARCSVGTDENSAKDMGLVVENAEKVRRATGAAVLLVHHSGKDTTQGARGSNALRGAASAEIECSAVEGNVTLRVRKQKDGPEAAPIQLVRKIVTLDDDPEGRPQSSLVLLPYRGETEGPRLTPSGQTVLAGLAAAEVPGGISVSVWRTQCDDVSERTFYNQRKTLVELGLVTNVSTSITPKYVTTAALEREDDPCED